ncbi:hypothetical protein Tco_0943367, partial [Tanacetum coccineum]
MLAHNPSSSYNGIPTFVNPKYLKKAQSKKPCLYKVPFDKDDLVNIFAPDCAETLILEKESISKLNKDLVKEYDYSNQNSLYEIFTLQTRKSLDEFYVANEIQIVDLDWEIRMDNRWQQPITQERTVLVQNILIPLVKKKKENAYAFESALKKEMFEDLEYVQSLEKEVDELKLGNKEFSNEYDLLLQECLTNNIMCDALSSMVDIDEYSE